MLNTIIKPVTRPKIISFVSLLVVVLSLIFTTSSEANSNPDKISKKEIKAKKNKLNKPTVQQNVWATKGAWSNVSVINSPSEPTKVVAIHMSVLPNGKVIFWGGESRGPNATTVLKVWDPECRDNLGNECPPETIDAYGYNEPNDPYGILFCSGHSFLPDGRLLINGGQPGSTSQTGINNAFLFDHLGNSSTNRWTQLDVMNNPRWYPTNLTLGNGNTLVWAGLISPSVINAVPQILEKQSDETFLWRSLKIKNPEIANNYYSWLYLLSSGKVFVIFNDQSKSFLLSPGDRFQNPRLYKYPFKSNPSEDGSLTDPHFGGSSLVYDKDKIIVLGGADLPKTTAEVIDLNDPAPQWKRIGRFKIGRRHLNTTLLPDGKVLITGGNKGTSFNNDCPENFVYRAEMWDPALYDPTNQQHEDELCDEQTGNCRQWTQLADATEPRLYHSTAVLLPDGRVLTGGTSSYSDEWTNQSPCNGITDNHKMEIFSPPYLFKDNGDPAERPVIGNDAPTTPVSHGQDIQFGVTGAGTTPKVNLIRLPSVTHSYNQNQGIVKLTPTWVGGKLRVTIPANRNECPPGHYMMFVLNGKVPSKAKIIQVL